MSEELIVQVKERWALVLFVVGIMVTAAYEVWVRLQPLLHKSLLPF